nr:cell death activator CIDE-3 isoform X1 [Columba livia]
MDYAKSLSLRLAAPVSKCVSASASMTQQLLSSPAPRPRPYRICNWDRSLRKGIMAHSLADLLRQTPGYQLSLSRKPPRRIDVACVTFDLYKTNPRDLGCLNVKATLYGTYSMSYDLRCYGAKRLMKEALRWTLFTMQATGHVLLGTSCYMQQLLDATEEPKEAESSPVLQNLLPHSLPPVPRRKTLQ